MTSGRGDSIHSTTIHNSIVAYAKSDIATWKNAWIVIESIGLIYSSGLLQLLSSDSFFFDYSAGAPLGVAQFGSIGFGEDPI